MINELAKLYIDFLLGLTMFGKSLVASITLLLILGILDLIYFIIKLVSATIYYILHKMISAIKKL